MKIPDRLKYLKKLKEGNEQQIVTTQIAIKLGEKKLEERKLKKEKDEPSTEGFAIDKKVIHHQENLKDLIDGLNMINDEIKKES
ncbi:unnamed protein product [marine sediment metagenome]|uniref:Uncharacterized protein n=1 Tax=marine sediment metagenome TaxID=412755 RepID=X0YCX5_9ZZZZ